MQRRLPPSDRNDDGERTLVPGAGAMARRRDPVCIACGLRPHDRARIALSQGACPSRRANRIEDPGNARTGSAEMTTMTAGNCGCWHCGEPLQAGDDIHAHIAGKSRAMCCDGCRAAAEWIEQLGLADYYRLRTQLSQKPSVATVSVTADPWSRPENARHVVRDVGQAQREVLLSISGVRCSACVWLI